MRIGCIIMASGESTRFGGEKLTAPFLGEPLILHTLRQLPPTLTQSILVTRSPAVYTIANKFGIPSILHHEPHQCDTIRIGISHMMDMDGILFRVGDQPLCSMQTISRMMSAFEAQPTRIVRAHWQTRFGNPVLFPANLLGELSSLQPGETGGAVIKRHMDLVIPCEVTSPEELDDIDTRAQLAALEARMNPI